MLIQLIWGPLVQRIEVKIGNEAVNGLSLGLATYLLNSVKCLHIHVLWCSSVKCFADSTCIVGFLGRLNEIVCVKCLKYAPFATVVMRYVPSFVNVRV